jgi:hypothetical protein
MVICAFSDIVISSGSSSAGSLADLPYDLLLGITENLSVDDVITLRKVSIAWSYLCTDFSYLSSLKDMSILVPIYDDSSRMVSETRKCC